MIPPPDGPPEKRTTMELETGRVVSLVIEFDRGDGQVRVTGPIENKGLCYLMLECARDVVKDNSDRLRKGQSRIAVPSPRIPPLKL